MTVPRIVLPSGFPPGAEIGERLAAMDAAEALLPWFSCAVAIGMLFVPLLTRDPVRRRDMQLSLNSGRWGWRLLMGYVVLKVAVAVLVAVVLLPVYPSTWGLFPLAAATIFLVGYVVYVDRLPFPDPSDEDADAHPDADES